jgi:hypothetical protein
MRVKKLNSLLLHIPIAKLRGLSIIKVGMNLTKFVLMPMVKNQLIVCVILSCKL